MSSLSEGVPWTLIWNRKMKERDFYLLSPGGRNFLRKREGSEVLLDCTSSYI
jgi:hypothetical protein